jgi:hypothetical protein
MQDYWPDHLIPKGTYERAIEDIGVTQTAATSSFQANHPVKFKNF